jgi:hypothetical protein
MAENKELKNYQGRCHCGAVSFEISVPKIDKGMRCNCSICEKKGAVMTPFTIAPQYLKSNVEGDALSTYQFGTDVARHHFCNHCGIYTFHETMRMPGHYRVNVACIDGINSLELPVELFDGASI